MSILSDYFQRGLAAQIFQLTGATEPDAIRFETHWLVYAAIRWHQLFENKFVQRQQIGLQPASQPAFQAFIRRVGDYLRDPRLTDEQCRFFIHHALQAAAVDAFGLQPNALQNATVRHDFERRMTYLLTMGACEFHGFNGAFEQSIRAHGLDPRAKFYQAEEIQHIDQILRKAGTFLGMAVRDQNQISTTTCPDSAYLHAKCSPEWFYMFSMGASNVNHAYLNRDYRTARYQVQNMPGMAQLSPAERQQVALFFDKYWQIFAQDPAPKMAIMPYFRRAKDLHAQLKIDDMYLAGWGGPRTLEAIFTSDCYHTYEHKHNRPIDKKWLEIIDLPTRETICAQIKADCTRQGAKNQEK